MRAAGHAPAALLQRVSDADARELQGRGKPEQKGTQHRCEHRVTQHGPVDSDHLEPRCVGRAVTREERNPQIRQARTDHTAERGQYDALDEQLPNEPDARRAERGADADFPAASDRAAEQEAGDVDAGEDKNDACRNREGHERGFRRADDFVLQRDGSQETTDCSAPDIVQQRSFPSSSGRLPSPSETLRFGPCRRR